MPERPAAEPTAASPGLWQNAPLVVSLLLVVDSLHFIFARLLHPYLPGGTSAFYVLAFATLEVGLFLGLRRRINFGVFWSNIRFFLSIGILVATSTTFNYIAVGYIDPGTASLLAQSATLFALGLGIFWLREKMVGREIVGALIALVGVFVISFQPGDYLRLGSLLVLSSALMYALHSAIFKRYGGQIEFGSFFFFRLASVTGFLLIFTTARGQLIWPSWEAWQFLILAGTVDVVISRVLYYLALRRLQLSYLSIILTLSPVITIIWSIVLFSERPTAESFIGGVAVLVGVLIVSWSKSQAKSD